MSAIVTMALWGRCELWVEGEGEGGGVYPTSPRRRAMAAPRPDAPPVRRTVLPLRWVRSGVCLRDSAVRAGERGWR